MDQLAASPAETKLLSNADNLEFLLQTELAGRVLHLRVVQLQGGIVLRGLSRTYYAKQIAQEVAMRNCDLPLLANEIEVVCLADNPNRPFGDEQKISRACN